MIALALDVSVGLYNPPPSAAHPLIAGLYIGHWRAIKQLQHSCTLSAPYLFFFFWLSERRYCAKQDYLIGELFRL